MNETFKEKTLTLKSLSCLNSNEGSNSIQFKSSILNCMGNNYLFFILVLTMALIIIGCNQKGADILTKEERTIVGGLYFGMPEDSLQYSVGKGINVAPFSFQGCWGAEIQPLKKYYYVNSFDFVEYQTKGLSGHYGLVFPKFKNGRMNECYIAIVNYNIKDRYAVAMQFANGNLLYYIPALLRKSYGEDSINYNGSSSIIAIENSGYNYYENSGIVHTFSPKFGKVQFNKGLFTDEILWDDYLKSYVCYSEPVDSSLTDYKNEVDFFPCIHYKLDPKYEEQLGMTSEKPL